MPYSGKAVVAIALIAAIVAGGIVFTLTTTPVAVVEKPGLPDTIKIGHVLPKSGPLAAYAEGFANGVKLAVMEINEKGGIAGRKVELIEEDSGTDPVKAAEAARKLIDVQGVKVIIGAYASSSTLAIAPIAEESKVVLISPASTSPQITGAGDYIFRVVPSDAYQGRALAEIALKLGFKTAATIAINNPYGIGIEETFKKVFEAGGGKVILTIRYELGRPTYKTELEQIRAANPDVIVDVSYADDGQIIFREAKELGIKAKWLAAEGIADPAIFKAPGVAEATQGMIATKPRTPKSPASEHFLALYKEKFGKEPGIYADYAYDATKMALLAIAMAGKYDGTAIKDALYFVGTLYKAATGDKTFDANGDVKGEYEILRVKGNEFIPIGYWTPDEGVKMEK
jgi:branched-chain amino acid transport system substrate-binding protein